MARPPAVAVAERAGRRSPIEVVRDLPRQLRAILHEQIDEARRELLARTRDARTGLAMLGVAAGLALTTLTTLAITAVVALAEVLPWWAAILAIVAPLAIATGVLAALGMRRLASGSPRAAGSVGREDVAGVVEPS